MHSVFSDGSVWPDIRVEEAKKDGLDVIAITEHLEYQPWKDDIPHPNRNRSYEYHSKFAKESNIIVINGSEITRDMPPGHSNAIFIKDANNFYTKQTAKMLMKVLIPSAILANTQLDERIHTFYQENISSDLTNKFSKTAKL